MRYLVAFLMLIIFVMGWSESRAAVSPIHIVQKASYSINAIPVKMQWIPTAAGVAANSAQYATRAVSYTPAVVGAATRTFLLSPGGLALSALFIAAGYAIDSLTGEVTQPGGTGLTTHFWRQYYTSHASVTSCHGPSMIEVANCLAAYSVAVQGYKTTTLNNCSYVTGIEWDCLFDYTLYVGQPGTRTISVYDTTVAPYEYEAPATTLTDEELGSFVESNYNELLPDILTDPATGKPYDTQSMTDQMNDLESDFNAQYDTDPVTVPDTDPATNDDALESQNDDLFDCDLFPTLCKWLTWFRQGEDLTLDQTPPVNLNQEVDISTYADFEGAPITFGGASTCPAPYQITALNESIELDYTPFCTLAGWLNPLLLAIATMIGIFYFVRIVSN